MKCRFSEVKHVDKDLLNRVWSILYKINDDQMTLCIDEYGICLMRKLPNGNYLEIYPTEKEVTWKLFDHNTEFIKQKIFKW